MLKSIHNIMDQLRIPINTVSATLHELSSCQMLQSYLSSSKFICPAIVAYQFNNFPSDPFDITAHVLVATGIIVKVLDGKTEHFVQCKNSYRDDSSMPGKD